jgi:putative endonuclease
VTKQAFVYIMTNRRHGTLYVGTATNLTKRVWEHRQGLGSKFTRKYNLKRLVFRAWKIELIESQNSDWHDLYEDVCL